MMTNKEINYDENPYELPEWEHPDSYFGFSPDGDFLLYSTYRDADALQRSNWECFVEAMEKVEEAGNFPAPPEPEKVDVDELDAWMYNNRDPRDAGPYVYEFEASCSMFGWHRYLMLRRDAPEALQREAYEVLGALSDYPVLDESHFSNLEWEEAMERWDNMGTSDRIRACAENGASIFAARRDSPPDELYEYLRDC